MRSRDVTIPLALWMCAAVCVHFLFGTGGLVVARMQDDRSELGKLSRQASNLAQRDERSFERSHESGNLDKDEVTPPPPPPPVSPPEEPKPPPVVEPPKKQAAATPEQKKIVVLQKTEEKK